MTQQSAVHTRSAEFGLLIITGGSSGIGSSIIEGFLKVGAGSEVFNLSRSKPTSFCNDESVHHLYCNLADKNQRKQSFSELEAALNASENQGPILLINNAGFGLYGPVSQLDAASQLEMLEVNVCALVELTTRLLPYVKRRGGCVMNIASTAAFQPTPTFASYGASKAFVLNWTLALQEELRGSSARALAVCPGPTRTSFFSRAGLGSDTPPGSSMDAATVAQMALKAAFDRKSLRVTGALNQIMTTLSSLIPLRLRSRLSGIILRRFRNTHENN